MIIRRNRFAAEVSTSSLNDIMFFLLLFFLIISTVANPSVIKLLLPKTKTAEIPSVKPIILSVTADKKYIINGVEVFENSLESELLQQSIKNPYASVLVRVDRTLTVQDLVDVIQIGSKNKIKMVLATEKAK